MDSHLASFQIFLEGLIIHNYWGKTNNYQNCGFRSVVHELLKVIKIDDIIKNRNELWMTNKNEFFVVVCDNTERLNLLSQTPYFLRVEKERLDENTEVNIMIFSNPIINKETFQKMTQDMYQNFCTKRKVERLYTLDELLRKSK